MSLCLRTDQNLCIYVLYYVLYYIGSLCSGGFADATAGMCWFSVWWGHDSDDEGLLLRLFRGALGHTLKQTKIYVFALYYMFYII